MDNIWGSIVLISKNSKISVSLLADALSISKSIVNKWVTSGKLSSLPYTIVKGEKKDKGIFQRLGRDFLATRYEREKNQKKFQKKFEKMAFTGNIIFLVLSGVSSGLWILHWLPYLTKVTCAFCRINRVLTCII